MVELPRLVIAAPASGHGKTTVATGLMAALRAAGHTVSGHKVGPDYIDPGYHALATGRPGRNLDPCMVGEHLLAPLLLAGARGAGIAVIEGVMGLYDGRLGGDGFASTAHVAAATGSPVLLVVDVSHASRSIAAVVQGMVAYGPELDVVGVVLNKAGSERHAAEVRRALEPTGVPVLGVLYRDDGISAPSRHLGLVPVAERRDAAGALDRLAARMAEHIDLRRIVELARRAAPLEAAPWEASSVLAPPRAASAGTRPVVAFAGGRAFTFRYSETEELLRAAGCEVAYFDPLTDTGLPGGTAGAYLGGGFPEVHAGELSANEPLRAALRAAVDGGVPVVAECAGLLYLCRTLDGAPMVGALDATARMSPRLTLGYRDATAPRGTLLAEAGGRVTGHEFHRTVVEPRAGAHAAWEFGAGPEGFSADPAATGSPTLHASYLHTHWAGSPGIARRFADAARDFTARTAHRFAGP
ncbi:cobyrinate a,c-diamide synthase [Actinocorallia populi]|uniref:cobyrinate a,c-diamide synthase n=1 Tax=Actinocorallia populi TaxID=2079200 RepID=UPI000D096904|nr:cobyrinate a,c-diamide synthase [Actinocorallia populi]